VFVLIAIKDHHMLDRKMKCKRFPSACLSRVSVMDRAVERGCNPRGVKKVMRFIERLV
jgi:hypothetical protein